jgi:hypothetical protein
MKKSYKVFLKSLLAFACPGVLALLAVNAYLDPYHFLRFPDGNAAVFMREDRFQNPGLVKGAAFDTAIIGSSVSGNFTQEMFPGDTRILNLTVLGRSAELTLDTLKLVLQKKGTKRVYLELLAGNFNYRPDYQLALEEMPRKEFRKSDDYPKYLYRPGPISTLRYLLSPELISGAVSGHADRRPVDGLYSWWTLMQGGFGSGGYLRNWKVHCDHEWMTGVQASALEEADILDEFARLMKEYPAVEIVGYGPPRNNAVFFTRGNTELKTELTFRRRLRRAFSSIANFKYLDLSGLDAISNDFKRFCDQGHFDLDGTRTVAKALSENRFQVNLESWKSDEAAINVVRGFNPKGLPQCTSGS